MTILTRASATDPFSPESTFLRISAFNFGPPPFRFARVQQGIPKSTDTRNFMSGYTRIILIQKKISLREWILINRMAKMVHTWIVMELFNLFLSDIEKISRPCSDCRVFNKDYMKIHPETRRKKKKKST